MEQGFGYFGLRHGLAPHRDLDRLLIGSALGLDPWRVALKENEQAPLRPGVF